MNSASCLSIDPAAAIAALPAGRWVVAVSGGADSVALARLMARRGDCFIILAHLDHQLRGAESDDDVVFVDTLSHQLDVPVEIGRRDAVERDVSKISIDFQRADATARAVDSAASSETRKNPRLAPRRAIPAPTNAARFGRSQNPSARYRAARLAFFAAVARRHACDGVLIAHHADDQAETVLLRLLRGSGLPFLGGMAATTRVDGLVLRRPLLSVSRVSLRLYLKEIGQPWREDASNESPAYRRNVVRRVLTADPALAPLLLDLAAASRGLRRALDAAAPPLGERFAAEALRGPPAVAEHAARRWLVARGAPADRVSPAIARRLITQATNVSEPPRQHYPGGVLVRRRQKQIDVIPSPPVQSRHDHGQETAPNPFSAEEF